MRVGVALLLVTACYSPQPSPGAPCPDEVCPTGLVCAAATHTCELHATDAGTDAPRIVDALIDGAPDAYVPPQPILRQQAANYANSAASLSATFPAAPSSGNLIVMVGGTPAAPLTSVTGGGVGTWQVAVASTVQSNVEIWYGITDGSSATITVALTNSSSPTWLSVSEWTNLTGAVDATSKLDGDSMTPATAGSITTTKRDLLVFGVSQFLPSSFGSPTPATWTALQPIDGFVKQRAWYRVEAPGTYGPSVSVSSSGWDAALAAFEIKP